MDTFKYNTNIDNTEGLTKVRTILDNEDKVQYWHVDILDDRHELTVTGDDLTSEVIKEKLSTAGFKLEPV